MKDHNPEHSDRESLSQLYRDVINMRGEMVCKFDMDTRLLQVNAAYAKTFGKTVEELIGTPFIDLLPKEEHQRVFDHLNALKAKKHEVIYEHTAFDINGAKVWQEWCDRAVFNADGSLSHFISVGRNINQRKTIEKELERRHRAESLLADIAKHLVNTELTGLEDSINDALRKVGLYLNSSRVYIHQYDFERGVFSNTHEWCADGIAPSRQQLQHIALDLVQEWLEDHKRGERVFIPDTRSAELEPELRQQMQRRGIKSLLMVPLIKNERCLGCLGVDTLGYYGHWEPLSLTIVDMLAEIITNALDRRQYEQNIMRARDKAQQAIQEKNTFLATLSHEIQNPLNGILGNIDLLRKTNLDAEQERIVGALSSSGTMLSEIMQQVSELQKAGQKNALVYSDVDLDELMHQVRLIFEDRLKKKRLYFRVRNNTGAIDGQIRGIYLSLKQVLVNFISNAIQYTDEGGIELTAEYIPESGNVLFSIDYDGGGITEEHARMLLNPYAKFGQLSPEFPEKEGLALGLVISRQLVHQMNGTIGIDTGKKEARGAHFWFQIPAAPRASETSLPAKPAQRTAAADAPACVLAAKMDTSIHVLLRQLEVTGVRYRHCEKLAEVRPALEAAHVGYHRLIIDLNLGIRPVLKFINELKNAPRWWDLDIVLLGSSAREMPEEWKESYDISRMLVKPLSNRAVAALLPKEVSRGVSGVEAPAETLTEHEYTRILVAEDTQVNQMLIRFILEKLGISGIDIVSDGMQALQKVESEPEPYDLILMDYQMPVLDGFETSRRIRALQDARRARTPIIAVTAFATPEYSERCIKAGMNKYITKPYTLSVIQGLLQEFVEKRPPSGPAKSAEAQNGTPELSDAAQSSPPIDIEQLEERFEGDRSLINTMLDQFFKDGEQQVRDLRSLAAADRWEDFFNVNHQIKGGAAAMSATALFELSRTLEAHITSLENGKPPEPEQAAHIAGLIGRIENMFILAKDIAED